MDRPFLHLKMNEQEIKKLLEKYAQSREKIENYIKEVESLIKHTQNIFPKDLNFRNKYILDDKIKTFTGFYSTLLNLRKEVNQSLIKEIELRKKINEQEKDEEKITKEDLRTLVKDIEQSITNKKDENRKLFHYPEFETTNEDIQQQIKKFNVFQQ